MNYYEKLLINYKVQEGKFKYNLHYKNVLDDKIDKLSDYIDEFGTFENCTFPNEE
ncbi:MAG TPA: hypothetical protein PKG88_07825 [Bacteroidales bacterium]|nr:hypothetical protein [Bacteroidales bacterium]HPS72111.1 hypothetical protein [Bacteroidales bacterium]